MYPTCLSSKICKFFSLSASLMFVDKGHKSLQDFWGPVHPSDFPKSVGDPV